jgi:hypothetical protein
LAAADGESAVEGDVECLERGLPAHGPAFAALAGGVQAHDGHVDALQRGGLVGEVPAGADGLADARVDAFDRVGRADDPTDLDVDLEERHELGPGVLPKPDDRRVPVAPFLLELQEPVLGGLRGRRGGDGRERAGDLVPVLASRVAERGPQEVHDAGLRHRLGPVLGTLAAVADLHVDAVDEDHRVDRVQGPVLPPGHAVHDLAGDGRDGLLGHARAVDLGQVGGYVTVRQTPRGQRQHHPIDAGQPPLAPF